MIENETPDTSKNVPASTNVGNVIISMIEKENEEADGFNGLLKGLFAKVENDEINLKKAALMNSIVTNRIELAKTKLSMMSLAAKLTQQKGIDPPKK